MSQGARDGGATMYSSLSNIHVLRDTRTSCTSDVWVEVCSCVIFIHLIHVENGDATIL